MKETLSFHAAFSLFPCCSFLRYYDSPNIENFSKLGTCSSTSWSHRIFDVSRTLFCKSCCGIHTNVTRSNYSLVQPCSLVNVHTMIIQTNFMFMKCCSNLVCVYIKLKIVYHTIAGILTENWRIWLQQFNQLPDQIG